MIKNDIEMENICIHYYLPDKVYLKDRSGHTRDKVSLHLLSCRFEVQPWLPQPQALSALVAPERDTCVSIK